MKLCHSFIQKGLFHLTINIDANILKMHSFSRTKTQRKITVRQKLPKNRGRNDIRDCPQRLLYFFYRATKGFEGQNLALLGISLQQVKFKGIQTQPFSLAYIIDTFVTNNSPKKLRSLEISLFESHFW